MIHVYLDDARPCPRGFVLARSAEECLLLLQAEEVDVLSLDYDLGWGNPNGMQAVRLMLEAGVFPKQIYLHTSSDGGRAQMYQTLYSRLPAHVRLANGPMPRELLVRIANNEY